MAYTVSEQYKNKVYSGDTLYTVILYIDGNLVQEEQIESLTISNPIIDDEDKSFYIGTFISQSLKIKFRNFDGLNIQSGSNVSLSIGLYIDDETGYETIPIGKYIIDELAEDYVTSCEITCLDYAVKFKNNIDYSELFYKKTTDTSIVENKNYYIQSSIGKITKYEEVKEPKLADIDTYYEYYGKTTLIEILQFLCGYFGVELGTYPTINNNVETTLFDNSISGKRYVSYIAEMFGGNAKIDRDGKLNIVPLCNFNAELEINENETNISELENGMYKINVDTEDSITIKYISSIRLRDLFPTLTSIQVKNGDYIIINYDEEEGVIEGSYFDVVDYENNTETRYTVDAINYSSTKMTYVYSTSSITPLSNKPSREVSYVDTINAEQGKTWNLKERYKISKVIWFDAINNWSYGNDDNNTLFIRMDNIFVSSTAQIENIYNAISDFDIYCLEEENVADLSLDAWDIIRFKLDNNYYNTINNNTITFSMSLMTKINVSIPTEQQEVTTNTVGTEQANYRKLKTTVDFDNNRLELLAGETKDNQDKLAELVISVDNIQNIFKITGGNNLIKNSAFLLKDNVWNFTKLNEENNYHTNLGEAYDAKVVGELQSCSQIKLKNTRLSSNIEKRNIQINKIGEKCVFNYYYKLDENATGIVKIINAISGDEIYNEELEPTDTWTRVQFPKEANTEFGEEQKEWIANSTLYQLVIESETLYDDMLYIGDMMLNTGEMRNWQPASGELSSTIVQMSEYGVQVISSSSSIATLMSADGFGIYPIDSSGNIGGTAITDFDDEGLNTGIAKTKKIYTGNYVMDEVIFDGTNHHIEYYRGGE